MAPLPDPRILPNALLRPTRFTFDYEPIGAFSRTLGGQVSFQEKVGGSLWTMSLVSRPMNERDYAEVRAWKSSLHGAAFSFKAYDLRRCNPLEYGSSILTLTRFGGGTFDGTATLDAVSGNTMTVSGLPAGYIATVGDYFSFPWLGSQRLVQALETKAADSSGVLNGINMAPWLLSGGTTGVTVTMVNAWVLMRMIPGSWSGDRTISDPVAFQAIEAPA